MIMCVTIPLVGLCSALQTNLYTWQKLKCVHSILVVPPFFMEWFSPQKRSFKMEGKFLLTTPLLLVYLVIEDCSYTGTLCACMCTPEGTACIQALSHSHFIPTAEALWWSLWDTPFGCLWPWVRLRGVWDCAGGGTFIHCPLIW